MKSLLILILFIALVAAAFLSRPSEASFNDKVKKDRESNPSGLVARISSDVSADLYAQSFHYNDHYLWTSMDRGGKAVYVGLFGHWFGTDVKEDLKEVKDEVKNAVH